MRIRRLYLENFGSHQRTELTFSDGVNAIIGNNGAGKTTLLEAIAYALYHKAERPVEDLIRAGAPRMRVELVFEVDGRTYLVIRERSRDGVVSAELYELTQGGRRLIQRDQNKVSSQIEAILGFGRDVFLQGIYVRQGEIQRLLEDQPARRKEVIARLLGIEILERIWSDLKGVIERLDGEIAALEREILAIGDVDRERMEVARSIEHIEGRLSALVEEISSLESSILELRGRVDELEAKRGRFIELRSQLDELKAKISSNLKRKEKLELELRDLDEELSKLKQLEALASRYEEISRLRDLLLRLSDLRRRLDLLRESMNELKAIESEIREIEGKKESLERVRAELEEMRSLKDEYIRMEAELKGLGERERRELRKLSDAERRFNEVIGLLRELSVEVPDDPRGVLEVYSRRMEELSEGLSSRDSRIRELEGEIERISAKMNQYSIYLEELSSNPERCPLCGSKLTAERVESLRRGISEDMEAMKSSLSEIEGELRRLKEERDSILRLIERMREIPPRALADISEELEESRGSLEEIRGLLEEIRRNMGDLELKLSKLPELEERYRSLIAELSKVDMLRRRADQIRGSVSGIDPGSLEQELLRVEGEVDEAIERLGISPEDIEAEYSRSREAFMEYGRIRGMLMERERLSNALKELEEEISSDDERASHLEEEIHRLGFDERSLERARSELREAEERLRELLREKGELEGTLRELRKKEKELSVKTEKLRELRAKKERYEIFRSRIQGVRELYSRDKGIQPALREAARPLIEREVSEIFGSFGFDYDSIRLDEDFTPILRRGNREYSFDLLSGGERISLALALRLAIARYLVSTKMESFILDEPTVHLDDERIEYLLEALSSLQIPQLIVVTHSPRFRDIASRSILVSKEGGVSRVEVLDDARASD